MCPLVPPCSLGVMLSYFAIKNSYIATVFTYGVMFGMGTGIAYPIPLGCAMKVGQILYEYFTISMTHHKMYRLVFIHIFDLINVQ